MGLAYTYGKALGEGYGRNDPSGDVSSTNQDPKNRRASRERYGFDVTHNAVLNYVYDLPIFRHSKGLLQGILGGWQSSGVITLRTGFPFTVPGGTLNTGSASYPDRVGDGRLGSDATVSGGMIRRRSAAPTATSRRIRNCATTATPLRTR
jgi:hypothetical protein